MSRASRWIAVLLALLAVSAYGQDDKTPAAAPANLDATLHATLREVINRGVEVYNSGEHGHCYRIFEGSLMTVKPLLAHRPDLQKEITTALASAEADPVVWRRAFTLRKALDRLRKELNPKKDKPDDKKPDDKKADDKKKDDKKKDDKKKGPEQLPPPMKDGQGEE